MLPYTGTSAQLGVAIENGVRLVFEGSSEQIQNQPGLLAQHLGV